MRFNSDYSGRRVSYIMNNLKMDIHGWNLLPFLIFVVLSLDIK